MFSQPLAVIKKNKVLGKVNNINWKKLRHAYGTAEDVPDQLLDLLSSDINIVEDARWDLYNNIFHQGARYEATPFAIPFLYELIQSEETLERESIILMLVHFALGYEGEYLPDGLDVSKFKNEYSEAEVKMTVSERKESKKIGYSPQAIIDCYEEVKKGIPILYNLIRHENKKISRSAIYALAWFPECAEESINRINTCLSSLIEEKDISNALLSIGLLARNSNENIEILGLEKYLESNSTLVNISAGICLTKRTLTTRIKNILINGLLSNDELKYLEDVYFNEGEVTGYISLFLARFGGSEKEKIVDSLCKILESEIFHQALDITKSLLIIINKERKTPIIKTELENLSEIDLKALTAILNHGAWKVGPGGYANYILLLKSAGIPDSQEKLRSYLKGEFNPSFKKVVEKKRSLTRTMWKMTISSIRRLLSSH